MYYGEKVRLRGVELEDVHKIIENWNNYELRRYLDNKLPNSYEEEVEFVKSLWKDMRAHKKFAFSIENFDGVWLGLCELRLTSPSSRSFTLGIAIHRRDMHGKGYGTDAVKLLCAIGFYILNAHRIELEYIDGNTAGAIAYERAGFRKVGRRREASYQEGQYTDKILMDILKQEFFEKFPDYKIRARADAN